MLISLIPYVTQNPDGYASSSTSSKFKPRSKTGSKNITPTAAQGRASTSFKKLDESGSDDPHAADPSDADDEDEEESPTQNKRKKVEDSDEEESEELRTKRIVSVIAGIANDEEVEAEKPKDKEREVLVSAV